MVYLEREGERERERERKRERKKERKERKQRKGKKRKKQFHQKTSHKHQGAALAQHAELDHKSRLIAGFQSALQKERERGREREREREGERGVEWRRGETENGKKETRK